jgi:hypothetical protein
VWLAQAGPPLSVRLSKKRVDGRLLEETESRHTMGACLNSTLATHCVALFALLSAVSDVQPSHASCAVQVKPGIEMARS